METFYQPIIFRFVIFLSVILLLKKFYLNHQFAQLKKGGKGLSNLPQFYSYIFLNMLTSASFPSSELFNTFFVVPFAIVLTLCVSCGIVMEYHRHVLYRLEID
jgi:hypothetical protein